jgi:hypothetical protein
MKSYYLRQQIIFTYLFDYICRLIVGNHVQVNIDHFTFLKCFCITIMLEISLRCIFFCTGIILNKIVFFTAVKFHKGRELIFSCIMYNKLIIDHFSWIFWAVLH